MPRLALFRPIHRPTAVAVGVLVLGLATFAPVQASTTHTQPAGRTPTIDTHKTWDKSQYVYEFGRPNTATYGQVVTIPSGKHDLTRFSFYMKDLGFTGSLTLRGEVYAWDGSKATGRRLYQSAPRTLSYGDSAFHAVKFHGGGVLVTPGKQYVIFASVSKDYESCTDGYTLAWGDTDDSAYPGGTFVFLNDAGDESQWTTTRWDASFGVDLAFKAYLS